ncbi:hypothetical protein JCM8547_005564 [Rhodosporidiobolus lusitaniae]
MSFTSTMLSQYAEELKVATEHAFLTAAGKHDLDSKTLSSWLAQDRAYALHGYPKFIAGLISSLPLSSPSHQSSSQSLLSLFSYSLSNIHREVAFFDSLGPRFGLDLSIAPPATKTESAGKLVGKRLRPTTKAYVDLLIATGAEAGRNGGGVEEGLVLLWAMEKVYFTAWTHAASQTKSSPLLTDEKTSAALTELIDNWTNDEFAEFVDRIEKEVEKLELKEGSEEWERCEEVFKYTLWLEQRFWPEL